MGDQRLCGEERMKEETLCWCPPHPMHTNQHGSPWWRLHPALASFERDEAAGPRVGIMTITASWTAERSRAPRAVLGVGSIANVPTVTKYRVPSTNPEVLSSRADCLCFGLLCSPRFFFCRLCSLYFPLTSPHPYPHPPLTPCQS